jgi:hypothetical protein
MCLREVDDNRLNRREHEHSNSRNVSAAEFP